MKLPFTGAGAWHFIVELLEAGQDVEQIVLDMPPGATGYVLVVPGAENNSEIYIKLELVGNTVHGRSFHISTKG